MDEAAVASKSVHRKPNEELDIDAVAYNINDLPEAILEHIVSFLPMNDAVTTCVLSKRWRYLWTSCPNLRLFEWHFSGKFTDFVDRVLLQGSSHIKQLVLHCDVLDYASRFNVWVSTAVIRSVEDCSMHLSCDRGNFVLPYCLFSCATLTRLKLCMARALELPSRIWLPNLKFLLLENIAFVDEGSTEQLLSSAALEELIIKECNWDSLETLTIRAPMLKILNIHDKDCDCRSRYYRVHPHGCSVLICGNNLETIRCKSPFLNDYQVEKSSSLLQACVDVHDCCPSRTGRVAYRLNKLLEAICSVKTLKLSSKAVDVLSSAAEHCAHLPVFPNLKLLNFGCLDLKQQAIVKLLHSSLNLEALKFREGIELYHKGDGYGAILDPATSCFGSHLRQIVLSDVLLLEKEVCLLELLLKHAPVLEKLMIRPAWYCERINKKWYRDKLLEILCGSKSLEIADLGS